MTALDGQTVGLLFVLSMPGVWFILDCSMSSLRRQIWLPAPFSWWTFWFLWLMTWASGRTSWTLWRDRSLGFCKKYPDGGNKLKASRNYNIREKEIVLIVNRRSNDKNRIQKIKTFAKECSTYFIKLKLDKEVRMIYKDFKALKAPKSLKTVKKILKIETEFYSSVGSSLSDLSGIQGQQPARNSERKKKNGGKPVKPQKNNGEGGCRIHWWGISWVLIRTNWIEFKRTCISKIRQEKLFIGFYKVLRHYIY